MAAPRLMVLTSKKTIKLTTFLKRLQSHAKTFPGEYLALFYAFNSDETVDKMSVDKFIQNFNNKKNPKEKLSKEEAQNINEARHKKITALIRIEFFKIDIKILKVFQNEFKDNADVKTNLIKLEKELSNKIEQLRDVSYCYDPASIKEIITSLFNLCDSSVALLSKNGQLFIEGKRKSDDSKEPESDLPQDKRPKYDRSEQGPSMQVNGIKL